MPIVRTYMPSAQLGGAVAFQAGQGQFRQRQDQLNSGLALDAARLNLQALDADRRFASAQQARRDALFAQQQAQQARAVQQAQAIAAQQAQQQQEFQQRVALEQLQQFGQQQYLQQQNEFLLDRDASKAFDDVGLLQQKARADWDRETAVAMGVQAKETATGLRQFDGQLKPEDDAIRQKFLQSYEALRRQQRMLPPKAFAEAMNSWMGDVAEADLASRVVPQPSMNELFQEEVMVDSAGRFWQREMRNGAPKWSMEFDPNDPKAAGKKDAEAGDGTGSLIKPKSKTYDEWELKAIEELKSNAQPREDGTLPAPTPKEIGEKIHELQVRETAAIAAVKEAENAAIQEKSSIEEMAGMIRDGQVPEGQPVVDMWLTAEKHGVKQIPTGQIKLPESLDEELAFVLVQTAPSGTRFILPDGKTYVKP